jgi:phage shock protein C
MEPKRFYRSTTDKKIGGVAAGLGEYFDLDPLLIRLIFVVLAFAGGGGVLIYIILWIITPEKPFGTKANPGDSAPFTPPADPPYEPSSSSSYSQSTPPPPAPAPQEPKAPKQRGSLVGGLVLITIGALFLADELLPDVTFGDLWPVILVVIGIGLLINSIVKR